MSDERHGVRSGSNVTMAGENGPKRTRLLSILEYLVLGKSEKLFRFIGGGDPKREENAIYIATKIDHLIVFAIIPIMVIVSTLILPQLGYNPSSNDTNGTEIAFLYFISFVCIILGAVLPKIVHWRIFSRVSKVGIFINHGTQTVIFVLPVVFGYFTWNSGVGWFAVFPVLCISAVALALTYPTRNRWKKWTNWTSLLD